LRRRTDLKLNRKRYTLKRLRENANNAKSGVKDDGESDCKLVRRFASFQVNENHEISKHHASSLCMRYRSLLQCRRNLMGSSQLF